MATFQPVSDIYFVVYKDNNGLPSDEIIATTPTMSPTTQILRGYNNIGFPIYEVAVVYPESIAFPPGKYWLLPQASTADNTEVYWEMTSTGNTGSFVKSREFDGPWTQDARNYNGVFFVAGECVNLSVDDSAKSDFSFYPNPIENYLNFKTNKTISEVKIYNLQGQQILKVLKVLDHRINLSHFVKGLYIVNTKFSDGTTENFKVIKK